MVVVVDFNYLPRGLTGNERTGVGLVELLVICAQQETGDQQRSRGTEDFGGGVYTRDPVTDSRGERENESC